MTLSDTDLVAAALGWRPGDRSTARAAELLDAVGGVRGLLASDTGALGAAGVTKLQADRMAAAVELVRRRQIEERCVIRTPADVDRLVGDELRLALEERFVVLCLDRRHRLTAKVTATIGCASFTIVEPAHVYGIALRHGAASIILVHNHPSGDPTPSVQDREVTQRVAAAGRVLGIPLLDHIVVATRGFASLAELDEVPTTMTSQPHWAA